MRRGLACAGLLPWAAAIACTRLSARGEGRLRRLSIAALSGEPSGLCAMTWTPAEAQYATSASLRQ